MLNVDGEAEGMDNNMFYGVKCPSLDRDDNGCQPDLWSLVYISIYLTS